MNIFRYALLCATLLSLGSISAELPPASDFSLETNRGISGHWVPHEGFETEAFSFYTHYLGERGLVYLNFEIEKTDAAGNIIPTWLFLYRFQYRGKCYFRGFAQSTASDRHSNRFLQYLTPTTSTHQKYEISLDGNDITLKVYDVDRDSETLRDNIVIDCAEKQANSRYELIHPGEYITRWKRYSISSHPSARYTARMAWVGTTPATEHPTLSGTPDTIAAFQSAAEDYKASLAEMTDDQLNALTSESLQTELEYSEVSASLLLEADALIADILATAQLYLSTKWDFRHNTWSPQEDGGHKAGSIDTRCYEYGTVPAVLSRTTENTEYHHTWSYSSLAGLPVGDLSDWSAESTLLSDETANSLSLVFEATTNVAQNPASSADGQKWLYDAATTTWENSLSHVSWSYSAETHTWTQVVMEADCESSSSCEWTYNDRTQTWTNTSLSDVWHQKNGHCWTKVGGSSTPVDGFSEKWNNHTNKVWNNEADGVTYSASNCGAWTEQSSGTLWRWNTSADCARGIWAKGRNETLEMCTYDDTTQRWVNGGSTEFPPPLLPPFVVTVHSDIIATYGSLETQGVL
jgi:hypothetical protein